MGVISAKGNKRASVYFISKEYQSKIIKFSLDNGRNSPDNGRNSLDNGGNSPDNGGNSLDNEQALARDELLAVFDNNLKTLIIETSNKKRWDLGSILQLIPQICKGRYFTLHQLSILLNRNKEHIRNHYIQYLVALGKLQKRCKEDNDPKQAYTSIED